MGRAPILFASLLAWSGAAGATLFTEQEVAELFAGLPQVFVIQDIEDGEEEGRRFRLRSAEPIDRGASGALYLEATVTASSSEDGAAAEAEIERRLAAADPDIGLSYAWDYVAAGQGEVVHLHAACTFSEESFQQVARALARKLDGAPQTSAAFWCRCGGGCRPGAPFATAPAAAARLPAVRRPQAVEQEEEEFDNRLDPSGAWTSSVGELSLMHHANRLAFSYSAVFGPTAHICEGAGVAGLVGRDRYEWGDEQGTVAFALEETGVRMELVDGIASFCGAGWPGDRFTIDRWEPPADCIVNAEHAHLHVVDTLDLERTPFTVGQGSPLEAVPARHTGDTAWVLGRSIGRWSTTMGLVARSAIDCATRPPAGSGR